MSTTSGRCLWLLEKCKNMRQLKQVHGQAITCGLGGNSYALSRLLAFCSQPHHPGSLSHGLKILQNVPQPTVIIYNTMMKACLLRNELIKTIQLYRRMLENGMYPDNYTLPYVLKACANGKSVHVGGLVHGHCLKLGFLFDRFVGNSLIMMYSVLGNMPASRLVFDEMPWCCVVSWTVLISGYARTGDIEAARVTFDEAPVKDVGVWGSMISGYVQNNCFKEGLQMFRLMQSEDIVPDEAIFVNILVACAHVGSLEIGIWIHKQVYEVRLCRSVRLGTALIDMYSKCGKVNLAKEVFDEMPERDTICWNVMISGLAMHGEGLGALKLFSEMERAGVHPDDITFIAIFTACSYSGMEYEGLRLFKIMCHKYNIEPKTEHYACIVDLLGRAGLLEEAKNIIQTMPYSCRPAELAIAWRALLSACEGYKQIKLAQMTAERLMELEGSSGVYVLLSNLYSSIGDLRRSKKVRKLMNDQGIDKVPGCSSIEVSGVVNEFVAGEKTHPRMQDIHTLLAILNRQSD